MPSSVKLKEKLNKILLDSKKAGKISDYTYKMLYSSYGYVHVFMAYLKFINREFLLDLLSLLSILRLMQFLVILREFCGLLLGIPIALSKNSCELADFIRDKTLNACEEMVSFDVVSLFTKIPVGLFR